MKGFEVIEHRLEDDPQEVFEFIRAVINLEKLLEILIFNEEEMREIENLENFF